MTVLPVAIVGAGPCGLSAAVALGDAGIAAVVFDKGCLVQSIADYPTNLTMFSTPEKLTIGPTPFETAGFRPTRAETLAYYRQVATRHRLMLRLHETVERIERRVGWFDVHTTPADGPATVARARAVVVATGYFAWPNVLGVPGEDLPHVSHRFVEGHSAFGRDALVVGGGNSAVEAAIELAKCGARVTLAHYEDGFVSHVIKPWVLPHFDELVADGAIRTVWRARVREILPGEVRLEVDGQPARARADVVHLMTGYTPQPGLLGELGAPFDPVSGAPIHEATTMETPLANVFVCGVMAAGFKANGLFIENGRGHGPLIAAALRGR